MLLLFFFVVSPRISFSVGTPLNSSNLEHLAGPPATMAVSQPALRNLALPRSLRGLAGAAAAAAAAAAGAGVLLALLLLLSVLPALLALWPSEVDAPAPAFSPLFSLLLGRSPSSSSSSAFTAGGGGSTARAKTLPVAAEKRLPRKSKWRNRFLHSFASGG
jgi:hypothetical protein